MVPIDTEARLAVTSAEYRAAHVFMREHSDEDVKISFPTVLLYRDGELQGILGTWQTSKAIVAGPLVLAKPKNAMPTVLRLVDAYEKVLKMAGVSAYLFCADADNKHWRKMVERIEEMQLYAEHDGKAWYKRTLQ